MSAGEIARLLAARGSGPLGIPSLTDAERRGLLDTFAPVYEIDVVDDNDRIGMPVWSSDGLPSVDVERPVVFRRIALTRFEGHTLVHCHAGCPQATSTCSRVVSTASPTG